MSAPTVDGLDIHGLYQPVTNWDAIPQYAVMSVKATEGSSYVQPSAASYWRQFRRRNFRYRGLYHWLRPDSGAQEQFDNIRRFVDAQGGLQVGEFIQNDWERTPGLPMPTLGLITRFNELCQQEWPDRLIVYVSDWVTNFYAWLATNPREPIWYANYNVVPTQATGGWQECAKYGAAVWQFTSSFMAPGITTRCDANHIFDWAAMERLAGYPAVVAPPQIEVEPPVLPAVIINFPTTQQQLLNQTGTDTMGFIAANKDNPADPARWYINGTARRHMASGEEVERYKRRGLLPATFNLGNPADPALEWLTSDELAGYPVV